MLIVDVHEMLCWVAMCVQVTRILVQNVITQRRQRTHTICVLLDEFLDEQLHVEHNARILHHRRRRRR